MAGRSFKASREDDTPELTAPKMSRRERAILKEATRAAGLRAAAQAAAAQPAASAGPSSSQESVSLSGVANGTAYLDLQQVLALQKLGSKLPVLDTCGSAQPDSGPQETDASLSVIPLPGAESADVGATCFLALDHVLGLTHYQPTLLPELSCSQALAEAHVAKAEQRAQEAQLHESQSLHATLRTELQEKNSQLESARDALRRAEIRSKILSYELESSELSMNMRIRNLEDSLTLSQAEHAVTKHETLMANDASLHSERRCMVHEIGTSVLQHEVQELTLANAQLHEEATAAQRSPC